MMAMVLATNIKRSNTLELLMYDNCEDVLYSADFTLAGEDSKLLFFWTFMKDNSCKFYQYCDKDEKYFNIEDKLCSCVILQTSSVQLAGTVSSLTISRAT